MSAHASLVRECAGTHTAWTFDARDLYSTRGLNCSRAADLFESALQRALAQSFSVSTENTG
jgi:hypothetical protein